MCGTELLCLGGGGGALTAHTFSGTHSVCFSLHLRSLRPVSERPSGAPGAAPAGTLRAQRSTRGGGGFSSAVLRKSFSVAGAGACASLSLSLRWRCRGALAPRRDFQRLGPAAPRSGLERLESTWQGAGAQRGRRVCLLCTQPLFSSLLGRPLSDPGFSDRSWLRSSPTLSGLSDRVLDSSARFRLEGPPARPDLHGATQHGLVPAPPRAMAKLPRCAGKKGKVGREAARQNSESLLLLQRAVPPSEPGDLISRSGHSGRPDLRRSSTERDGRQRGVHADACPRPKKRRARLRARHATAALRTTSAVWPGTIGTFRLPKVGDCRASQIAQVEVPLLKSDFAAGSLAWLSPFQGTDARWSCRPRCEMRSPELHCRKKRLLAPCAQREAHVDADARVAAWQRHFRPVCG